LADQLLHFAEAAVLERVPFTFELKAITKLSFFDVGCG
jgi:hypothetical protein